MEIILVILALFLLPYIIRFAVTVVLPLALLCAVVIGGFMAIQAVFGIFDRTETKASSPKNVIHHLKKQSAGDAYLASYGKKSKKSVNIVKTTKKTVVSNNYNNASKYGEFRKFVNQGHFFRAKTALASIKNIPVSKKKEFEELVLAKVRPIPASQYDKNLHGYLLLDALNPTDHYKSKIKRYRDARDARIDFEEAICADLEYKFRKECEITKSYIYANKIAKKDKCFGLQRQIRKDICNIIKDHI